MQIKHTTPILLTDKPLSSRRLSKHDHRRGGFFRCSYCRVTKAVQQHGGTGYARDKRRRLVCFACCAEKDRESMIAEGKAVLYLEMSRPDLLRTNGHCGTAAVSNWPGTLKLPVYHVRKGRHNMAGSRYDVYFTGPDKRRWHGVQFGENTQLCHCRRIK